MIPYASSRNVQTNSVNNETSASPNCATAVLLDTDTMELKNQVTLSGSGSGEEESLQSHSQVVSEQRNYASDLINHVLLYSYI